MANKKNKSSSTKTYKEQKHISPQLQTSITSTGFFRKYFSVQTFCRLLTAMSILLNFWFAYLALQPKVTIDYASHIIPDHPTGLPIKISNRGYLPIYNVVIHFNGNLRVGTNFYNISNIKARFKLCNKLTSNKSVDYIFDSINLIRDKKPVNYPLSGYLFVIVEYQLPILSKIFSEQQKYSIYNSQDGYAKWVTIQ